MSLKHRADTVVKDNTILFPEIGLQKRKKNDSNVYNTYKT